MANMVFAYPESKIKKIEELAKKDDRTKSGFIQLILLKFLKSKGVEFSIEELYDQGENNDD